MKFLAVIALVVGGLSFTTAQAASSKSRHAAPTAKAAHHASAAASSHKGKAGKAQKTSGSRASAKAGKSSKGGRLSKAEAKAAKSSSRKSVAKLSKAQLAKLSKKERRALARAELADRKLGKKRRHIADDAEQSAAANDEALMLDSEVASAKEASELVAKANAAESGAVPYADAVNTEEEDANIARERVYDGLLPGEGYTVTMDSFPDQNGSTECVQLIKSLLDAPRTIFWKEGRKLAEHFPSISPGTAIATFVKGQYPQHGRTGMHAAIFVRATQAGIFVLDQFRGRVAVTERFIPWYNPSSRKRSNNAITYSTIRW